MFLDDVDRRFFLACLEESIALHGLNIHAYVLMSNHIHLLATGERASSIPNVIQGVARRYVPFFNRRHQRLGTLWETRYRSALVQTERYLVNCQRYIELNPVRAGIVRDAAEYRWSSHLATAFGVRDDLVAIHDFFRGTDYQESAGSKSYRSLFRQPMDESLIEKIRDCTQNGWGIGDDEFLEWAGSLCNRRMVRIARGRRVGARR